jgi:ATP-dependent DNA helicase HFM1/MER3
MRGGEKSFYKELNKANEIRFPIKVDIALSSHKVSLILQAALGSVRDPSDKNFDKQLPQFRTDTLVVFAHANRLIRCIIDCQLSAKDSIGVKNALELARSIAAKAWDNTPNTLRQIPRIGGVYMRKLASKGINSIETFMATEPARLDLVLGKQNPFGSDLLKSMTSFPDLMVTVKEMERKVMPGKGVTLKVKSEIGFLNAKAPTIFNRTQIYVCFLLEDSNGNVIDFRRFGARKLEKGEEILCAVELTKPTTYLRTHVMCDEIAGTAKFAELQVQGINASVYPKPDANELAKKTKHQGVGTAKKSSEDDLFDDGIADDDLLAAGANPEIEEIEYVHDIDDLVPEPRPGKGGSSQTQSLKKQKSKSPDNDEDEANSAAFKEPVKLANGNWTCQHDCKDKGIECKHACCREGVKKPKKRPNKVSKSTDQSGSQQKLTTIANVSKKLAKGLIHDDSKSNASSSASVSEKFDRNEGYKPKPKRKLSNTDSIDDIDDFEFARPTKTSRTENSKKTETTKHQTHKTYTALDEFPELEDFLGDSVDCDWDLPTSHQPQPAPDSPYVAQDNFMEDQPRVETEKQSARQDTAPFEHVSMAEVQLSPNQGMFSGRDHSTRGKMDEGEINMATPALPELSDDFFGTPRDVSDFGGDDDTGPSNTGPAKTVDHAETTGESPASATAETPPELARDDSGAAIPGETEEQKNKRLWEERQRSIWAQFDPWLYEQYGSFVELI